MILLVAILFTAAVSAAAAAVVLLPAVALTRAITARVRRRLHRDDDLLPARWWERFEADFRDYASREWQAARESERQP